VIGMSATVAVRCSTCLPTSSATTPCQAQSAVGSSADGDPSEEARGFIADHVRVALTDRETVLAQVGAIDALLDGRAPPKA
jgi:hypothetical protein